MRPGLVAFAWVTAGTPTLVSVDSAWRWCRIAFTSSSWRALDRRKNLLISAPLEAMLLAFDHFAFLRPGGGRTCDKTSTNNVPIPLTNWACVFGELQRPHD